MTRPSQRFTPQQYLRERFVRTPQRGQQYLWILNGFQRFVAERTDDRSVSQDAIRQWLHDRTHAWRPRKIADRARVVDGFLDWMVEKGALTHNPFAILRTTYHQRHTAPVVRALLQPDVGTALEALRPPPPFSSFFGATMQAHVGLMQAMGYRYTTQQQRLRRLDRFLQGRPDLAGAPLPVVIREWANARSTPQQRLECHVTGRTLSRALSRIDPAIETIPWDQRILEAAHQRHRRPYIFSEQEVRRLLATALSVPSTRASLRPQTLHMMLVFAYCAGLRLGEIVRLDLGDFDVHDRTIEIRDTKFFKSRRLPLPHSVVTALQSYLDARHRAGGPTNPEAPLFWQERGTGRYACGIARKFLVDVLRRAGLKPAKGRVGPRIHDVRHAFVVNRMLAWYRDGINPQSRLPYLATYLGHKDINSTLVYLTITQDLLQQASERFRVRGAHVLRASIGEVNHDAIS
jgi:integrase/recombinase XerD